MESVFLACCKSFGTANIDKGCKLRNVKFTGQVIAEYLRKMIIFGIWFTFHLGFFPEGIGMYPVL